MSSTSRIFAATESGQHILKVEGYTSARSSFPNGSGGSKLPVARALARASGRESFVFLHLFDQSLALLRFNLAFCPGFKTFLGPPMPNGKGLKSSPFTLVGHRWSIVYYPNRIDAFFSRYVSLYLVLEESVATPVTARIQFSITSAAKERHRLVPCFPKKKTAPTKSREGKLGTYGMRGWPKFIRKSDLEKHLMDDSFTVRCEIGVLNGFRGEEVGPAVPRAFVTVPPSDLDRCLRGLLETGRGADATFEVAGERFVAHRWLLAARSPAFSAELLEQSGAASDVVRVDKMQPRIFKALLSFMYTDSLSLPETTTKQEEAALAQHLLVAAHRYGMERLKLLCEERLCGSIDVGTAASILALAEPLGCRGLKDACFDFLGRSPGNLKAFMASEGFEHLSSTCPSVLKDLVALGLAP